MYSPNQLKWYARSMIGSTKLPDEILDMEQSLSMPANNVT